MGLLARLLNRNQTRSTGIELPAILTPEDPVNFDSVLDWLVGLSDKEYATMLEVVATWRKAYDDTAKTLKTKNVPTTQLKPVQPTDEEIDTSLDGLLETDPAELRSVLETDPKITDITKRPSNNKGKKS